MPDGIGDLCQNADLNADGIVNVLDLTIFRRLLTGDPVTAETTMPPAP